MYKFYIYFENKLFFDSQKKNKYIKKKEVGAFVDELVGEGIYDMDDVAWDLACKTMFLLFDVTVDEDRRYQIVVEEIDEDED
ncbi:MAG: hypothetical protein IJA55_03745 [Clostridia bacterium]|nr:hypothetical protein [Clostridia bacterium]